MKSFVIALMVMAPGMVWATTDCHVIEYPDHFEAVCTGDEKSIDTTATAPSRNSTTAQQPPALQTSAPGKTGSSVPTTVVASAAANQKPVARRQGRQQYQQDLKDAKEMRNQIITEHLRNQPPPDYVSPSKDYNMID
jgi:hypothetical protein